MNFSIQSAKTIDEAVEKALLELKATPDEVEIEVIEEPSGGFLGLIGGKDAIVKVKKKMDHKDIVESILKDEEIQTVRTVLDEKAQQEAQEAAEDEESDEVFAESEEEEEAESTPNVPAFERLNDEEMEAMIRDYIDRIMGAMDLAYTCLLYTSPSPRD